MKKYLIILFSLLAVFTFTSCSDDEKDDEKDSVTEVNIYVSDETEIMYDLFDTEGTNPIECMLVKEGDAGAFAKYAVDSPVLIDKDGKIYASNGGIRPQFDNCRIYLDNVLDKNDPNWVMFNRVQYMALYAYVFSPLSGKISLVSVSGGGPMLEDIISESELDNIASKFAVGEEQKFVVVLVNVNRKGLQRLEIVIRRC